MPPQALTVQFTPDDFRGGQSSAVVSIKGSIAPGVITFSLLGPGYVGQGIVVGMLSLIVAGRMAVLLGSAPDMIAGPKATTSMAFATRLTQSFSPGRSLSRGTAPVTILAGDPGCRLAGFQQGTVLGETALFDGA
jgi:MFS superfamily sulfate permease-like transporter